MPENRSVNKVVLKKPIHTHSSRSSNGVSMDGIIPVARSTRPAQRVQNVWKERPRVGFDRPEFIRDPVKANKPDTKSSKFRKLLAVLQYPMAALILIIAVYSTVIGQWIIAAYALYAVIRKLPSQATFIVALLMLISIPIFQLLQQSGVADNIAVYTYELLVVGALQAVVELMRSSKRKRTVVQ